MIGTLAVLAGGTFLVRRGLDKNIASLDQKRKTLREEAVDIESKITALQKELAEASPPLKNKSSRAETSKSEQSGANFYRGRRLGELHILGPARKQWTIDPSIESSAVMDPTAFVNLSRIIPSVLGARTPDVFHVLVPELDTEILSHQIEDLKEHVLDERAREKRALAVEARKHRSRRVSRSP